MTDLRHLVRDARADASADCDAMLSGSGTSAVGVPI
jgi:hypothetical protein